MTRKHRIKRKKKSKMKIKKNGKTIKYMKGGAHLIVKEVGGGILKGLLTMFQYSILSIITGPIYLMALLANAPFNNINNLSGKRLNEVKTNATHNQLYNYLFNGYNLKKLKKENFNFPKGSEYKLEGDKVFVECDDCKKMNPEENIQKGGSVDLKNDMKKVLGVSGISDVLGLLDKKEKMQSILSTFFDYLNNLQMTDVERRDLIHKLIGDIHNKDAIMKCLIIINTIFSDDECNSMKKDIDLNVNRTGSTFMERPTISRIPNPFMIPGQNSIDLKKSIKCITGHIMYKRFGPETLTEDCLPNCPNCTLRTSLGRLFGMYGSFITQLLKGNNKDLDLLSELFYNVFNINYKYEGKDDNEKMEKLKESFIKSITNLPEYDTFSFWKSHPKNVQLDKIKSIIIDSKFKINDTSPLKEVFDGSLRDSNKKKNILKSVYGEDVYEKFRILLCKYNIIDELKKRYVAVSFENYYSLVKNIIQYPKEEIHKKAYITWCNKFLDHLYKVHGIDSLSKKIDPKYYFNDNDINSLVLNSNNPLLNGIKNSQVLKK